ncbi:hypothetical protein KP77_04780 [Jeotgalibacillus alimentarius]|uniref:Group-specific protein n=1 Tax=Jeotgalibacillus alimentarius TaxID=135826 RepID=A0A0C2VXG1_9BACL|nr:DUF4085 family protein [Jeotgalibacillus alimentarius]KIL53502.1 hypothetical protein KP77_04780 [Jeotgalibacillus alimentarius]
MTIDSAYTWNIDKTAKELFRRQTLLPIPESDDEWHMLSREGEEEGITRREMHASELNEVNEELKTVLPERFIPYLENGQLNQPELPDDVRKDYLRWIRESEITFEQKLDAAYENKKNAAAFLTAEAADVFTDTLHDGVIQRIERADDTLRVSIDLDSGFSQKSLIILTFKGIVSEEADEPLQTGQWYIYDELQKGEDEFALRVLFESPESQWTLRFTEVEAECFFRPKEYVKLRDEEKLDGLSIHEYLGLLNENQHYRYISPLANESISLTDGLEPEFTEQDNPIRYIYTDIFEDPYAHVHEPMPSEQIEPALLSDDIELQVQAWNTLYQNPQSLAAVINRLLQKLELTDENEMVISIYVQHFYDHDVLDQENIRKFQSLID